MMYQPSGAHRGQLSSRSGRAVSRPGKPGGGDCEVFLLQCMRGVIRGKAVDDVQVLPQGVDIRALRQPRPNLAPSRHSGKAPVLRVILRQEQVDAA